MNNLPRVKLEQIIEEQGIAICREPKRLKSLLMDLCADSKLEINILTLALTEDIARELFPATRGNTPPEFILPRLVKRLQNEMALTDEAARWAIESWALALHFIQSPIVRPNSTAAIPAPVLIASPFAAAPMPGVPPIANPNNPVLVVSRLGFGQYKTISDAIKAANPNTRIVVKPGEYEEELVLDKPLEIIGEGSRDKIVVTGQILREFSSQPNPVFMSGMTFRYGKSSYVLVSWRTGILYVSDCQFDGQRTNKNLPAIEASDRATITFRQSSIQGFNFPGCAPAVAVERNSRVALVECSIFDCTEAIRVSGGIDHVVRDCTIKRAMTGLQFSDKATGQVDGCDISGCELAGVLVGKNSNFAFHHCTVHDNKLNDFVMDQYGEGVFQECQIINNRGTGIKVIRGNPRLHKCRVSGNSIGIEIAADSAGSVEGCDLRGNRRAAMVIANGAQVQQSNNQT